MKAIFCTTIPLYLIGAGVLCIALQNAGVLKQRVVISEVQDTVNVRGSVEVGNRVSIESPSEVTRVQIVSIDESSGLRWEALPVRMR